MRNVYKAIIVLAVLAALYSAWYLRFEVLGNFGTITPGVAYRSGQLSGEKLAEVVDEYGIKSVLNLRGATPGEKWYDDEISTSKRLGIAHYDVGIRGRFAPPPEKVERILNVFETAPRPILMHCRAGADRAGLAAAMWKMVVEGQSKEDADDQLTIWYGHIPFGQTSPLDDFLESWEPPKGK